MARKGKRGKGAERTEGYAYDVLPPGSLSLAEVDLSQKVRDKKAYREELKHLQRELFRAQIDLYQQHRRA